MSDTPSSGASYDSKVEAESEDARAGKPQYDSAFVKMWCDALSRADEEEKDWRKKAEETIEVYRGKEVQGTQFNILHSNIETLCPALYNSTPAPDVRRRYADEDPAGRVASQIIERALSYSVDSYDFDATMKFIIRDGELPGRGVPRVRYEPTLGPMTDVNGQPVLDVSGQPQQQVIYEAVTCDYVPWRYFRRGPGRTWKDVPWIAFGDFLNKESIAQLIQGSDVPLEEVPLEYTADTKDGGQKAATEEQSIFRRALVWQIWDRETRKVISICTDYQKQPLAVVDDPLELEQFFPVPRPYQPVVATDSITPVVPYSIYEKQVNELNELTRRINKLVKQVRPRALYGGSDASDIVAWANADDGELVPATNIDPQLGMEKMLSWFPLEHTANALNQLVQQREIVKATIYEITGVADILRGASNPTETATAQQIKSQWGSLRIQERQAEVSRICRDLFRLKAEIISNKFSWETISQMTGIKLPTMAEKQAAQQAQAAYQQQAQMAQQAGQQPPPPPEISEEQQKYLAQPAREEVEPMLRSDLQRNYRVDVESDSTVRGDMTRNQQRMSEFLNATAQFASSMGPIIQQLPQAAPVIVEIYASFSRNFRLGKQAEDALANLSELAKQMGQQGPQPDPKADAAKAKADADVQKTQMDMQASQAEHQMNMEKMQGQLAIEQQKFALKQQNLALEQQKFELKQQDYALEQQHAVAMSVYQPVQMVPQ